MKIKCHRVSTVTWKLIVPARTLFEHAYACVHIAVGAGDRTEWSSHDGNQSGIAEVRTFVFECALNMDLHVSGIFKGESFLA